MRLGTIRRAHGYGTGAPRRALTALLPALVGGAVALGGCSSGGGVGGEAGKPAAQILSDSKAAMRRLSSVHIVGSVPASPRVTFDVVDGSDDGGGSFVQGFSFSVVRSGTALFVMAPAGLWEQQGASPADAQTLATKWLKTTTSSQDLKPMVDVTSIAWWLSHATTANLAGKGAVSVFHGRRAIVLLGGHGSRIYVSLDGKPYWLGSSDSSGDSATFDDFDSAHVPSAPSQYVDTTSSSGGA